MNDEQLERIAADAYVLAGVTESPENKLIVKMTAQECMSYCNREDIPTAMEITVSRIAAKNIDKGLNPLDVVSHKEGDMSESYALLDSALTDKNVLSAFSKIKGIE